MSIIKRDFYARDTLIVAKDLLGQVLCRKVNNKICKGIIVEVEAYTQDDPACHAYKGLTGRCASLFAEPGTAYVYLIYGIHNCVNISTYKKGYGSGVLIRALEPLQNIENTNGPSKICKAMCITRELDGKDVKKMNSGLWLEYGEKIPKNKIVQTTRIGITKAADYKWRFYIKDNKFVSKL